MSAATASPQLVVTSGTFSIDGEDFAVDNNIWIVGDDEECLVIDAAHEAGPIVDAVGGRRVVAIVCTHGHNDHINAAVEVADAVGAPIALHADDLMLWEHVHPGREPDLLIEDGARFEVGGTTLVALHTPGPLPRRGQPPRRSGSRGVRRRHVVQGWAGRDRSIVLRLPDDHRVDPHPAAHAAVGHRRVHRSRRHDDDRRRSPRPRRLDRPRSLAGPGATTPLGARSTLASLSPQVHRSLTSVQFSATVEWHQPREDRP